MGHFRSNLRDIEFNLFEVFRVQEHLGSGPFEGVDIEVARDTLRELNSVATGPLAASFADADRNPPVFDPATHSVALPQSLKDAYRVLWDGEWWRLGLPVELGGYGVPPSVQWAAAELILGRQPGGVHVHVRPRLRRHRAPQRHPRAAALGRAHDRAGLGRHDGAHRARCGVRRRRGPHQGRPPGRRLVAPGGREAVHHLGRPGRHREHHAHGARPPRGREAGHQGPLPVPRAQVPLRPGHRRAGRAQRRVRHQPRAQDGAQGAPPPASSRSASTACPPSATCSARCTTASPRCSR